MKDELKTVNIILAVAGEAPYAQATLSEAAQEVNRKAVAEQRGAQINVIGLCKEGAYSGFYRGSPRGLIEKIRVDYNPDIVIAIFRGRFGAEKLDYESTPDDECDQFSKTLRQEGCPRVLLYFLEKDFNPRTDDEEKQKEYFRHFRWYFRTSRGRLWEGFNKQRRLQQLIQAHLWEFVRQRTRINSSGWSEKPALELPDGWQEIDAVFLDKQRRRLENGNRLSAEDATSFFDGEYPKWWHIVSDSVPRRGVVEKLENEISRNAANRRTRVTLLLGPGGEGKSTILRQVAANLALNHRELRVIWRDADKPARLAKDWLKTLRESEEYFVIVCDNAAQIVEDIWQTVRALSDSPANIQFLLASSSLEWEWEKAYSKEWLRTLGQGNYREEPIRALTEKDAALIVKAWAEAGPQGLGTFIKEDEGARAGKLYRLAEAEERKNPQEGSFLGAMLEARKSATLEGRESSTFDEYVGNILGRLDSRPAPGNRTLRDVFAYIVALHADGKYILTKPILRYLLKCSPTELEHEVIEPLVEEADVSVGLLVLARHRAIARAARRLLAATPYRVNFEYDILPKLVRAPIEKYHADKQHPPEDQKIKKEELTEWNKLPDFYAEQENPIDFYGSKENQTNLALRLAEALADAEPDDPMPLNTWAHIYRKNNKLQEAANVFRRRYHRLSPGKLSKGFFTEWAAAESRVKNHCCDAWLCGIALSDKLTDKHPGDSAPMILLSSLTSAFEALYGKASNPRDKLNDPSNAQTFLKACVAAGHLGDDRRAQVDLRPGYNKRQSERHLLKAQALGVEKKIPATSPTEAIDWIINGIVLAWEWRHTDTYLDNFPFALVPDANKLKFDGLRSLFASNDKVFTNNSNVTGRRLLRR